MGWATEGAILAAKLGRIQALAFEPALDLLAIFAHGVGDRAYIAAV
jgi:hypothetical protein